MKIISFDKIIFFKRIQGCFIALLFISSTTCYGPKPYGKKSYKKTGKCGRAAEKIIQFSLIFSILFLLTVNCNDPNRFVFPYVYMDASINIDTDPEFASLRIESNAMQVLNHPNGGTSLGYDNNGIIIFHGVDRFYAFDRTCPNDLPQSVAVELKDNSTAVCPVCKSVFVLPSEGQPAIGSVSKYFLHQYSTYYSGGVLQIYN